MFSELLVDGLGDGLDDGGGGNLEVVAETLSEDFGSNDRV